MGRITEILNVAQGRGSELKLPYEGALMPDEAYEIMRSAPGATLVERASRPVSTSKSIRNRATSSPKARTRCAR